MVHCNDYDLFLLLLLFFIDYYFLIFRLADKSRFAYDGLKRQRLVTPMIRDCNGELKPVDWEAALLTVAKVIKNAGKKYYKESVF